MNEFMLCGYSPLEVIGNEKMIKKSADHQLLDMYPILPTIDLEPAVLREHVNSGGKYVLLVFFVYCLHD